MTLTLKSREIPLAETLAILRASWTRLRAKLATSHGLAGGVAFLELTLNAATRLWHPHLHVLFEGRYIAKEVLSKLWLEITGDSFIVDIRFLRTSSYAAGYVAKYAGKAFSPAVINDKERLIEAIDALQGARTFATFGSWSKLGLSRHPEDTEGWEPLRPLYLVILDARNGDAEARKIIMTLTRSDADDALTLFPHDTG